MFYKEHKNCRICGSDKLTMYLDLGNLPLSNNLCESVIEFAPTYPTQIMLCEDCGLSQLSIVVDPEILFGHYLYMSGMSDTYKSHCSNMAESLKEEYGLNEQSFHVDLAGNDGTLLLEFKKAIGHNILNVDPAKNLAAICLAKGVPTLSYFWSEETGKRVVNGFGKADLITATNVIAHVDDIRSFMVAIRDTLKPTGVCIIECPYLIDFLDNGEWATTYQEHVSYMSVSPFSRLCKEVGLALMKVEKEDIHCGSIRMHVGFGESQDSVFEFIKQEPLPTDIERYASFSEEAKNTIQDFRVQVNKLTSIGAKVSGFACSAKGNTLLNCSGVGLGLLNFVIDQTPSKIGKFSPGTHLPIVDIDILETNPPDYIIILSWNFVKEIMDRCRAVGYIGKFIVPCPNWQILD